MADGHGGTVPAGPHRPASGRRRGRLPTWGGARAVAYRRREHIADDLGTAVNVQAMVFGNRDEQSGTGVAFTRNPSTGERVPFGDFLVNAQGEDVVAGIRNTESLDGMAARFPEAHAELLAVLGRLEAHYRRHVRHRVHDRAAAALDAADPRRQAHRRRRAADGRRDDGSRGPGHHAGRGAPAGHRRPPRPGAAPAVRRAVARTVLATGLGASPGAAVGRVYFTPDACVDAVDRGRAGDPRPQRDVAGGRARHAGGRGHPHRPGRPRQPRRRRGPRVGHPRGGRRRAGADRATAGSPSAT